MTEDAPPGWKYYLDRLGAVLDSAECATSDDDTALGNATAPATGILNLFPAAWPECPKSSPASQ